MSISFLLSTALFIVCHREVAGLRDPNGSLYRGNQEYESWGETTRLEKSSYTEINSNSKFHGMIYVLRGRGLSRIS